MALYCFSATHHYTNIFSACRLPYENKMYILWKLIQNINKDNITPYYIGLFSSKLHTNLVCVCVCVQLIPHFKCHNLETMAACLSSHAVMHENVVVVWYIWRDYYPCISTVSRLMSITFHVLYISYPNFGYPV